MFEEHGSLDDGASVVALGRLGGRLPEDGGGSTEGWEEDANKAFLVVSNRVQRDSEIGTLQHTAALCRSSFAASVGQHRSVPPAHAWSKRVVGCSYNRCMLVDHIHEKSG